MSESFDQLVDRYHRLVMSLIHRYYGGALSDQADDLSQEIWAKLWESFKKNENNIVNFKSYLYRTAQTTLWDAIRELDRDRLSESEETFVELGNAGDEAARLERVALAALIDRLGREEARMARAYLKGFNNEEIAELLGCSEGRVRNLMTRIKKKLAKWGGAR